MVRSKKVFLLFSLFALLIFLGCESLKTSKPIMPIKEYEKMIAGRIDADYIGTARCLSACHAHDKIRQDFEASTMGAQLSKTSGVPLVNCESCHGPGSLAVEGITSEKVEQNRKEGKQTACKYDTLINLKELPSQALSLICLKCHSANATFALHNYNAGAHTINEVSCSDCHKLHAGPDLKVKPRDTVEMCTKCHEEIKTQFSLPSHHPIPEKKVFCTDCHFPMGSTNEKLLRKNTVKEVCAQCHPEKEGPFVFEHADITEECNNCHTPHGSINNKMLIVRPPFLCLQCHRGHGAGTASTQLEVRGARYTNCTDCHSQIHGTDIPSATGQGEFHQ